MRFKTVEYVIELQNVLSTNQEKFKDKISLIRETYNQESEKFKNIFPQSKYLDKFYKYKYLNKFV